MRLAVAVPGETGHCALGRVVVLWTALSPSTTLTLSESASGSLRAFTRVSSTTPVWPELSAVGASALPPLVSVSSPTALMVTTTVLFSPGDRVKVALPSPTLFALAA
ncbi:hypothetical protein D3C86_911570 [compost metagenome]